MSGSDESFLERWSRRKREAEAKGKLAEESPPAEAEAGEPACEETREEHAHAERAPAAKPGRAAQRPLTAADFADVDFDALDFNSDYARFMQPGVPLEIRNKALRKLWASNPVFTEMDGLDDYFSPDFTDAACAVPSGLIKTAYRVGRGFLSDEEVAEWEALGKPKPSVADARAAEPKRAVGAAQPPTEPSAIATSKSDAGATAADSAASSGTSETLRESAAAEQGEESGPDETKTRSG